MSSKDVLSEGEVDALMDTFSEGEAPAGDPAFQKSCEPFDFSTREQNQLAQIPPVKNLNEKVALALALAVRKLYGFSLQVEVEEPRLLTLQELFAELPAPTAVNMVRVAPLNGTSYVILPGEMLSVFVDNYFGGGSGEGGTPVARENLTHSERRVNDALTESFLATLTEVWREKVQLTATVDSFESNPEFLQAPNLAAQMLAFPFSLQMNEWSSSISWVVPYASIELLRAKLGSVDSDLPPASKNADWEKHFVQELQHIKLELTGAFLSEQATIEDVLGFKTGSIVPLKVPTQVMVSIEDEAFSMGEHGVVNGHKSIKITEFLTGKD